MSFSGVTPSIQAVAQLRDTGRTVSFMWMCREADLVEYFLHNQEFDKDAWTIIYYTGQRRLVLSKRIFERNSKLLVCKGRPNFEEDLLAVMRAIESRGMLPQQLLDRAQDTYESLFDSVQGRVGALLQRALLTYPDSELWELAVDFSIQTSLEHFATPDRGLNSEDLLKRVEEKRRELDSLDRHHCCLSSGSHAGQTSPTLYPSTAEATPQNPSASQLFCARHQEHPPLSLQNAWTEPADCEVNPGVIPVPLTAAAAAALTPAASSPAVVPYVHKGEQEKRGPGRRLKVTPIQNSEYDEISGCSVGGFERLIQFLMQDMHVLDDVMGDVLELFSLFLAGSRALNKTEFHQAIASLTENIGLGNNVPSSSQERKTSRRNKRKVYTARMYTALAKETRNSQKDIRSKELQEHADFRSWQVLYCGGAKAVVAALQAMHKKYHFALEIESFAW